MKNALIILSLCLVPALYGCTEKNYIEENLLINKRPVIFDRHCNSKVKILSDTVMAINCRFYPDEPGYSSYKNRIQLINRFNRNIRWIIRRKYDTDRVVGKPQIKIDRMGNIMFHDGACGEFMVKGIVNEGKFNEYETDPVVLNVFLLAKYNVGMSVSDARFQEDGKVTAITAQWTVLDDEMPDEYDYFLSKRDGLRNIVECTIDSERLYSIGEGYLSCYVVKDIPANGSPSESCYAGIEPLCILYDVENNCKGDDLPVKFNKTEEKYFFYLIKGSDYRSDR